MPNMNKMIAVGHLGRDPELRYMTNGKAVCSISIACTEKYKDKSGEWKENTEWVRCSIFDDLGELVSNQFSKGDAIHVEGKQRTRKWQDKEGNDKYITEVNVFYVAMPIYVRKEKSAGVPETQKGDYYAPSVEDSDIPF